MGSYNTNYSVSFYYIPLFIYNIPLQKSSVIFPIIFVLIFCIFLQCFFVLFFYTTNYATVNILHISLHFGFYFHRKIPQIGISGSKGTYPILLLTVGFPYSSCFPPSFCLALPSPTAFLQGSLCI